MTLLFDNAIFSIYMYISICLSAQTSSTIALQLKSKITISIIFMLCQVVQTLNRTEASLSLGKYLVSLNLHRNDLFFLVFLRKNYGEGKLQTVISV